MPLLAALVAASVVPAHAAVTVALGTVTAARGAQAKVPVTMSGGVNVAGIAMDVLFPGAVLGVADPAAACTLAPGVPGTVWTALVPPAGEPPGMDALRIVLIDMGGATYADGLLFHCTFTVAASAPSGTHAGTVSRIEVSDSAAELLPATAQAGAVTVCSGCCG